MRLAVISSRFPCGNNEPFLGAELATLRPLVDHLIVAPLRPAARPLHDVGDAHAVLLHAFAPQTFYLACKALSRSPKASLRALGAVLRGSGGWRVRMKNLAIFPRALALAERLAAERVDHVHSYWLSTPATAAFVIARVNGITWSSSAHRWDIFERNMTAEKAASAGFIRTISERGRLELRRQAPRQADKFVVVRLGTAVARRPASPASVTGAGAGFHLLCAAAFRPVKGHAILLDAFAASHAQDPSLRLTLCGEGPLQGAVRARARTLSCSDAITFRGYVEHAQLLRELGAGMYGAVVLASLDDGVQMMEGIPSILIEASSLGVASIATRSGAVAELLDDESAFLADPGETHSLTQAILAAANAPERARRAAHATRRARVLHDPRSRAADLVELFGESA